MKLYFSSVSVTKRAFGVELLQTVGNRKRTKKLSVRIESICLSKDRDGLKEKKVLIQGRVYNIFFCPLKTVVKFFLDSI